jgi:murein DD-endopeptidase MepM/ murein hydrolase activator NlpD
VVGSHKSIHGGIIASYASKSIFLLAIAAMPFVASAGFTSFLTSIFGVTQASTSGAESTFTYNAQTMELLEAPRVLGTTSSAREVTIIDNNSIASSAGPLGTETENTAHSTQISTYEVKKGDTLSQIAEMFNVSVNTIVLFNDIKRGQPLREGQRLAILPISGLKHTVAKGDTVESIAKRYKAEPRDVIDYNDIIDGKLALGSTIIVPNGEMPAEIQSVPKSVTGSVASAARSVAQAVTGYFMRPAAGKCTQGVHGNNGVDIGGAVGSSIVASAGGKVIIARGSGWNGGYGNYIVIAHPNGTQTLYAHLSTVEVSEGATVAQGQRIGGMGNTGKVYGPTGVHLHWEVRGVRNPFCN